MKFQPKLEPCIRVQGQDSEEKEIHRKKKVWQSAREGLEAEVEVKAGSVVLMVESFLSKEEPKKIMKNQTTTKIHEY